MNEGNENMIKNEEKMRKRSDMNMGTYRDPVLCVNTNKIPKKRKTTHTKQNEYWILC